MWYVQGRMVAPSDSELRTRSSGLRVPLGSAEHGGWVAGGLWGTLDIDPNPNGILPLQRHGLKKPHNSQNGTLAEHSALQEQNRNRNPPVPASTV